MKNKFNTPEEYIDQLAADRKPAFIKLRTTILQNLPKGFVEEINYGMIGYVVPHSLYPNGYHVDPKLPLPFINIASQKSHIALYHMGIYADKSLLESFVAAYPNYCKTKLDMGKSCIRFKNPKNIPFELIAQLVQKMTPEDCIKLYETNYKK